MALAYEEVPENGDLGVSKAFWNESEAMDEQYSPHVHLLYGVALRYTGNQRAALSLTEDALRAAMREACAPECPGGIKMRLLRLLRRTFVQQYCMTSVLKLRPQV